MKPIGGTDVSVESVGKRETRAITGMSVSVFSVEESVTIGIMRATPVNGVETLHANTVDNRF